MGENQDITRCTCATITPNSGTRIRARQDDLHLGLLDPALPGHPRAGATSKGFGSAHANGVHMGYCDGRVDMLVYKIDFIVELCLSCRNDGRPIDAKSY